MKRENCRGNLIKLKALRTFSDFHFYYDFETMTFNPIDYNVDFVKLLYKNKNKITKPVINRENSIL